MSRRYHERCWWLPDRKGRGLLILAVGWVALGLTVQADPVTRPSWVWHMGLPIPLRIGIWWAGSAVALVAAWRQRWRSAALFLLIIAPAIRATSFLIAWAVSVAPGPPPGYPMGWRYAILYALVTSFVYYIAGPPAADDDELAHRLADLLEMDTDDRGRLRGGPDEHVR